MSGLSEPVGCNTVRHRMVFSPLTNTGRCEYGGGAVDQSRIIRGTKRERERDGKRSFSFTYVRRRKLEPDCLKNLTSLVLVRPMRFFNLPVTM